MGKKIEIDRDLLFGLLYEQELSQNEIARQLGTTGTTVHRRIVEYGFVPLPQHKPRKVEVDFDTLHRLYVVKGLSLDNVGKLIGLTGTNVRNRLIEHGIPTRPNKKYTCNKNFFDDWSPEMAWVLGLLFADGNITKRKSGSYTCRLHSTDIGLLEQVRSLTDSTRPISSQAKGRKNPLYCLIVAQAKVSKILVSQYGMHPNKSRTIEWPNPPQDMSRHFMRGLWDGDGCIHHRRRGSRLHIYMRFSSSSEPLLRSVSEFISNLLSIRLTVYHPIESHWSIELRHKNSIRFAKWLYQDSTPQTRLARKFEKIRPFLMQLSWI